MSNNNDLNAQAHPGDWEALIAGSAYVQSVPAVLLSACPAEPPMSPEKSPTTDTTAPEPGRASTVNRTGSVSSSTVCSR